MAEMWYYTNEGKQMDPVSIKELKRLVGDGTLKPTDMIWKEGMPRWIRASSLKELFPDPMTALDKFFSHTKDDEKRPGTANALAPPISVPGVPSASSTTATTAAAPKVEDVPQKRKPSSSDADTDDAPVRRRPEPKSGGGGGNIFIILFLLFGAFVLLAGLFGGVVLIIVMVKPSGDQKVPIGDDKDKKPDQVPGLEKPARYEEVIAPGATSPPKKFRFRQGIDYEISARCNPKPPGVAVHIIVREGGKEVKSLRKPGADQYLRWTPRDEGEYTVEFTNFAGGQELKADVTIQESKSEPLEPGAREGNDTITVNTNVKPGKDYTGNLRFRVKGGYQAKIAVTGQAAGADFHLLVYKDNNPNEIIARDERQGPNPNVTFSVPKTEYVRIRVQNTGKVASKLLITYNVSP